LKINLKAIYRITVDEFLDENLARYLLAPLKRKRSSDINDLNSWGREESILFANHELVNEFSKKNYETWTGFLNDFNVDEKQRIEWGKLKEGQVYIIGRYTVAKKGAKVMITAGAPPWDKERRNRLHRFDLVPEVKTRINTLYNTALLGRKKDE